MNFHPSSLRFWLLGLVLAALASVMVRVPASDLPVKSYRVFYLPEPMATTAGLLDDRGNVFGAQLISGAPRTPSTEFLIYRPSRDGTNAPGVQRFLGPVTPNRGALGIVDINQKGQFICSEDSRGTDHRFLWDGAKFVELQPPSDGTIDITLAVVGWPDLYASDHLSPQSIHDDGSIWGTCGFINWGGGDFGGQVRWNLGGLPTVTFDFRSEEDFLRYARQKRGRSERGSCLRYILPGNGIVTNAVFWDGQSNATVPIHHPPSEQLVSNDRDEVAGIDAVTREMWLHLSKARYGLIEGYHVLTGAVARARSGLFLNNAGQVIVKPFIPTDEPFRIWQQGGWRVVQAHDSESTNVPIVLLVGGNSMGTLVAWVKPPPPATGSARAALLVPDDLTVTTTVSPSNLALPEEFDLQLDLQNNSDATLTKVGIVVSSLRFEGAVIGDWTKAPASLLTLAPGKRGTLHYGFKSKAPGAGRLVFQVEGLNTDGERVVLTEALTSPEITVVEPISLSLQVPSDRVTLDERFPVIISIRNNLTTPISGVEIRPPTLGSTGTAKVESTGPSVPAVETVMAPGATQTVTNYYLGTKPGTAVIQASLRAMKSTGEEMITPVRSTDPFKVGVWLDLVGSRKDITGATLVGEGIFSASVSPDQTLTAAVVAGGSVPVDLYIVNTGNAVSSPVLRLGPGLSKDWSVKITGPDGSDITAEAKGPDGWEGPILFAKEHVHLVMVLTASDRAAGSNGKVELTVVSTKSPETTSDVWGMSATSPDVTLELDRAVSVVGHAVVATTTVRNPFTGTMQNVSVNLTATTPGVPMGGVAPASVASLPPGAMARFTRKFAMAGEGRVDFEAKVTGRRANGTDYAPPVLSKSLTNGFLRLRSGQLMQVLPKVPLIVDKPAMVLLFATNTTPYVQDFELSVDADTWRTEGQEPPERFSQPSAKGELQSGERNFIVTRSDNSKRYSSFRPGLTGTVQLKLFPETSAYVPPFDGQTLEIKYEAEFSFGLDYRFGYLVLDPSYSIPSARPDFAARLQDTDWPFLVAAYPISPEPPKSPLLAVQVPNGGVSHPSWPAMMEFAEQLAISSGIERLVVVFPEHPDIWPVIPGVGEAAGWAFKAPAAVKHVVSIAETNVGFSEEDPSVSAHEIGHTVGFEDVIHPTVRTVEIGVWVDASKPFRDVWDLMDYASPAWINPDHYKTLVSKFTSYGLDPEVVVLGGLLGKDGTVTTHPWSTQWTDDPTPLSTEGSHAIEFKDSAGGTLVRHLFTPVFEAHALPAPLSGVNVPAGVQDLSLSFDEAPFVFSIPRPPGLSRITISKGSEVVYERAVTAHPPIAEVLNPSAGASYGPGDTLILRWNASDPDGGRLWTSIQFSADGGTRWQPLALNVEGNEWTWKVPDTATRQGVFRFQVSDGVNTTTLLSPKFEIRGSHPSLMASAGLRQTATVGSVVKLDGSGSHDPSGRLARLNWRVLSEPAGAATALSDATSDQPSFTPLRVGTYVFRVEVMTDVGRATSDTSVVVTEATAPVLGILDVGGGRVELRWLASAKGYELQSAPSPMGPWGSFPTTPVVDGVARVVRVEVADGARFFRLVRP